MIEFNGWRVPPGFKSDGCTHVKDGTWGDACVLHDFVRRYDLLAPFPAGVLLARHLRHLGAPRYVVWGYSTVSWLMAWKYPRHLKLPPEWAEYAKPI